MTTVLYDGFRRQDSLVLLDASDNGLGGKDIEDILDLYRLETLNLADNDIQEMAQVRPTAAYDTNRRARTPRCSTRWEKSMHAVVLLGAR